MLLFVAPKLLVHQQVCAAHLWDSYAAVLALDGIVPGSCFRATKALLWDLCRVKGGHGAVVEPVPLVVLVGTVADVRVVVPRLCRASVNHHTNKSVVGGCGTLPSVRGEIKMVREHKLVRDLVATHCLKVVRKALALDKKRLGEL